MAIPVKRESCGVSRELMNAIAREDWTELKHILSESSRHVADSVVTQLISKDQWSDVRQMIECVEDEDRTWNIEGIVVKSRILLCVAKRDWTCLKESHNTRFPDSTFQWIIRQACTRAIESQVIQLVLFRCADDRLDSVLTILVEQRLWTAVGRALARSVSDSTKQWAVREACEHCTKTHFGTDSPWSLLSDYSIHNGSLVEKCLVYDMLPHCADDQLNIVLTTLVERRMWQAVLYVLKRGVSDSSKRWVVLEVCACCNAVDKQDILSEILLFCADDQADCVLTTLVERRLWQAVLYVLKRGVSDSSKRWVVLEVCTCCESVVQEHELSKILLLCADDHADFVLTTLVERRHRSDRGGMLKLVGELLKQGVSETVGTRAVEETWKAASRHDFIKYVLPHCPLSHLNSVMPNFVKQGELTTVDIVMRRHRKDMEMESFVLPLWYVDVLPSFVERRLWKYVQEILHSVVMNSLCHWRSTQEGEIKEDDSVLWAMVNTCRVNATCAVQLFMAVKEKAANKVRELHKCLGLAEDFCELLYTSLLDQVCVALCSEETKTDVMTDPIHSLVRGIYTQMLLCLETIRTNSLKSYGEERRSDERDIPTALAVFVSLGIRTKIATLNTIVSSPIQRLMHTLKQLKLYYTCRQGDSDDEVLLMMFAVLPLSPGLQSVALRIMLRHKRWDVISQADLSGVWEQDRRHLLQAAVKQRQRSVVKRWADHTLYDDQRVWALNETLNAKQWDVALLLADHGLTDIDLMRVHYRLAKYADWDVILHMFERGADVAEVGERLERMKDNKRIPENVIYCIGDRCRKVRNLEKEIQKAKADALEPACHSRKWISVLFTLIRNPDKQSVHCALKVAIQKKAWHVVMQLVRLGMDSKQRHALFSRMMKRRQWDVCRVLLEQGLSVRLCLKVLPQLMEMNQWALVARVMEHDLGDDVRQQVMQRAWERREGSVVWLCIKSLPTPLSEEEREALFQRAFSCELWQVIKPLVEEKDETGIRHRDTALLEAIDQHQWDLVDHCQWHHADINMKDDDGHTPLQRAAMKKDWEAVEELVVRDGDPNLMDREGYTVLHRAIDAQQWNTVKLLIEYQADIHKVQAIGNKDSSADECSLPIISLYTLGQANEETPLGMLINARRVDIIDHTLFWCPDQSKGVNYILETSLHVACLSGRYDSMYNLVARRVNPLAVTKEGQSALMYAVLNKDCPQRMVSECIRLGFSTHQPKLTNIEEDLKFLIFDYHYDQDVWPPEREFTSPFLCALLRGLPVVAQMLYGSGACSQKELFMLYTELPPLADPNTETGRKLQERAGHAVVAYQNFVYCIENIALPYLTEMATTPRSLVSTCRLVISHCLTLSKTRHRDVDQLPLTERMKNFVLFSDLTDPDFGKDTTF